MKSNIIGAFLIFVVTIAILVLLNSFSSSTEELTKEQIAIQSAKKKQNSDLATNRLN